jgi:hypothetical protein
MRRHVHIVLIWPAIATCLWAQSTSQISGTVKDASGGAVVAAEVRGTQTATGLVRSVTTGTDGAYILQNLPIGPYMIEVTKEGFSKYVQSGIVLNVDSNPTIEVALKVGAVSEQVTVEANGAQVETHSTAIGQVVDNQRVAEMPLNGRNPIELVFLAGMASAPGNGAINTVRNYPTVVVSVAGGQGNGVSYLLDGTLYQDPYNNLSLPLPFPDALQEFKVETSALPAQYGYHSGASVNAVTKSGTNEYHGDLFEFIRNGDFNARDFFATARDTLKRNQFGGTVGGPVLPRFKDKLFFFGGYQRTSQRSDPTQLTAFVPTAATLAGDFTAFASPACNNGKQINLLASQGFNNNTLPVSLLNPVTLAIQKTLPLSPDPCGKTLYGLIANQDEDLYVARMDYQKSDKQTIFGRFSAGNLNVSSTYDGRNALSVNQFAVHDLDYQLAIGHTYLISANLVNSFRAAASRANVAKIPDRYKSLADFGANYTPAGGPTMSMTVAGGGGFNIGTSASVPGQSHDGLNPSVSDDVNWIHGNHQIGFGGHLYWQGMNYWSGLNGVGSFAFNGTITGLGMADFLTGNAVSYSQGTVYGFYNRQYYASMYAQDSWKVTPRLTLNYGLRWEPYLSIYSKYGQIHHFDPTLFAQNVHSSVFTNAPAGAVFPGDPQYGCGNNYFCDKWGQVFPRIGAAWDPTGSGKMTIRAAWGMYGDRNHMFYPNQMSFGPPFADTVSLSNVNISNPWANYPGGNPIPFFSQFTPIGHAAQNAPFPTSGQYVSFQTTDFKPMYVDQWNLSIQKQIGADWLLSANYLGNAQIHLTTSQEANPAVFLGLGACSLNVVNAAGVAVPTNFSTCSTTANQNQRRVYYLQNPLQGQYYGGIGHMDTGGTGSYEGLYFSVQKRLNRGITLLSNYTWSHCISDVYDQQTTATAVAGIPGNRRAYRSNCAGSDLRQLFVLNMVATMPKFANRTLNMFASNWQIAPILQIRSAQFFTVTSGIDRALTVAAGQTPNLLDPNNVYADNKNVTHWLNPAAFGVPALGTYGNLGQNNMRGPGTFQLNMALSRTFVLHEKKTLQLRAEAFNLPNHLNASVPIANFNAGNFGSITTDISGNAGLNSGDYRIIQFAGKFVF